MAKVKCKSLTPKLEKLRQYEALLIAMRSDFKRSEIELSEESLAFLGTLISEIKEKAEMEREAYLAKQALVRAARAIKHDAQETTTKSRARAHPGTVKIIKSVRSGLVGKTSNRDWKKVK